MRDVVGDVGQSLWILMGSIGVVLLIACANVANLMLVRAEGRHQELAICSALGASRWRVTQEFLLESVVIGVLGTGLGLALAWGALHLLIAVAPPSLPRLGDIGIDLPVLGFTALLAIVCSLAVWIDSGLPLLRMSRAGTGLREGGRSLSQGRERHRTRNTLVVIQVSLAFVLLICSGLMIRTFRALTHVNPGFDVASLQTLHIDIPDAEVPDAGQSHSHGRNHAAQHGRRPGVTGVGIGNSVPLDDSALDGSGVCAGPQLHRRAAAAAAAISIRLSRILPDDGHSADRRARLHLGETLPEAPGGDGVGEFRPGILGLSAKRAGQTYPRGHQTMTGVRSLAWWATCTMTASARMPRPLPTGRC